ncbi:NAD(P)-dependent oxidoreductase [Candidatus Poriferisocius sp.]|uniref:NAD(P)-dependent oxidoreductase n=1 Tax=Candidatus Poriferisocius sp. TaxID=3101276 RepID=UPI003B52002A
MPSIGWVGTGVMGVSMCGHVLDAGYPVTVTTRSRAKADGLIARGAVWAETPAEVAARSDISCAIVGFPHDVREVFLGEHGLLSGASPGSVLIDMTTSEPALAIEIAEKCARRDVSAIDAPVSGGDIGARNGMLSIMVGGDEDVVERVRPVFDTMGKTIVRQGGPGAGQHTKAVNQILIATGMIGLSEALLYGQRAGLDLPTVMESVSGGAAGSWSLSNYGPRILAGDFEPGFFVDHFVKDMDIARREAAGMKLPVPGLALAHELYVSLQALGLGRKGTQSLILALAHLADLEWEPPARAH